MLGYLESLTFSFKREGRSASAVLIYAEPDPDSPGAYRSVAANESGYEGIACVDDTARAALLALSEYERTGSQRALRLARRWLSFVEYMQYPDGSFANFIRNAAGIRNATGSTSFKGGLWWSSRALWALSRAYRLTRKRAYLERYLACKLPSDVDPKIQSVLALAELELFASLPTEALRRSIVSRCESIIGPDTQDYFRDDPGSPFVHLWGYHQLHAVAAAARILERPEWLKSCRRTVGALVEPDVKAKMWYDFPARSKDGVCAYTVAPIVQGLAELYRATGAARYRALAFSASDWFYGRNDVSVVMYDPTSGMCRDGIGSGIASSNFGAESAIEAGFAELERQFLLSQS